MNTRWLGTVWLYISCMLWCIKTYLNYKIWDINGKSDHESSILILKSSFLSSWKENEIRATFGILRAKPYIPANWPVLGILEPADQTIWTPSYQALKKRQQFKKQIFSKISENYKTNEYVLFLVRSIEYEKIFGGVEWRYRNLSSRMAQCLKHRHRQHIISPLSLR